MYYSNMAIWDRPLGPDEIAILGGPGAPVPEPATWALLMFGTLLLLVARGRRR
jgi:hypothetical protein